VTQLGLPLPAREYQERIADAVLEVLRERGDTWASQAELATEVRARLGLVHQAESTLRRRVKDAVHALRVERRILIASGERGYRLDPDRSGLRRIVAQIRSEAAVLRAYDAALADNLTAWLDIAEAAP